MSVLEDILKRPSTKKPLLDKLNNDPEGLTGQLKSPFQIHSLRDGGQPGC